MPVCPSSDSRLEEKLRSRQIPAKCVSDERNAFLGKETSLEGLPRSKKGQQAVHASQLSFVGVCRYKDATFVPHLRQPVLSCLQGTADLSRTAADFIDAL